MTEEIIDKNSNLKSLEKEVNNRFKKMDKEIETILKKIETLQKVLSGRRR